MTAMNSETNTMEQCSTDIDGAVSADRLTVTLTCTREFLLEHDVIAKVKERLSELDVKTEPDLVALKDALDQAREAGTGVETFVVARGSAPEQPQDGQLDWAQDFFSKQYHVDPESNRCDYRQMAAHNSVEKGELLVTVIPAKAGQDGEDVLGRPIKVRQPKNVRLRNGPNVYWDEKDSGYHSNISGRVRLTADILDVDDVYTIRGDVGPETSSIRHPGAVVITGNVTSEFSIEADGTVEIKGHLYASDVKCGGDLVVMNGITSALDKTITVKGSLKSRYISNARIVCYSDVCVATEICSSDLKVRGQVSCRGRVVGGTIVTLGGLRVDEAGSEKETKTTLVAGLDFELLAAMETKSEEIKESEERLKKAQQVCNQLRRLSKTLTSEQREKLTELDFEVMELEDAVEACMREKAEMTKKLFEGLKAEIRIDKILYPGTTLRILNRILEITESLSGPLLIKFDNESKVLTIHRNGEQVDAK